MRHHLFLAIARSVGAGPWGALVALAVMAGAGSLRADPATDYYFTTLAGASSIEATDGSGTAARFYSPTGVALGPDGTIYVADSGNNLVRQITAAGFVTTMAGRPDEGGDSDGVGAAALFNAPSAIAVNGQGVLYVVDRNNRTLRKITPGGAVTTLAGLSGTSGTADGLGAGARFKDPQGITIDPAGNLFVTDSSMVRKVTPGGLVSTLAGSELRGFIDGSGGAALFYGPSGLSADSAGNLYVADRVVVRKVTPAGTVTTLAGDSSMGATVDGPAGAGRFSGAAATAVDAAGNIFVTDQPGAIRKIAPDASVTTVAGAPGVIDDADGTGPAAAFAYPAGIAADATGNLVVADRGNNLIRRVSSAGVVTTLAGLSPFRSAGATDGIAGGARFFEPFGVVVNPAGIVYVADRRNYTVRKILPDGTVTTLAGAAGQAGQVDGVGAAARFKSPTGLALDPAGNLWVIDLDRVRKVTPAGLVSTVGGVAPVVFPQPTAIAAAPGGDIYVATFGAATPSSAPRAGMQRITPAGQVFAEPTLLSDVINPHSILSGLAFDATGVLYACDATYGNLYQTAAGGTVRSHFNDFDLEALAIDATGRIFLIEGAVNACRVGRLAADGQIEVIGGSPNDVGHHDDFGTRARFDGLQGIAVDGTGALYLTGRDNTVRKGVLAGRPIIVTHPQSQAVPAGGTAQFAVAVAAIPAPTYQWFFNGAAINGATGSSFNLVAAQSANAGEYSVTATNTLGSATSKPAVLAVTSSTPVSPPSSGGGTSAGASGGGAPSTGFLLLLALLGARRGFARREQL